MTTKFTPDVTSDERGITIIQTFVQDGVTQTDCIACMDAKQIRRTFGRKATNQTAINKLLAQ